MKDASKKNLAFIFNVLFYVHRYLSTVTPDLKYYYMGYYIHDCPKMNYKGSYSPSFLLDLSRLDWVLLDSSRRTSLTENKRALATAATDDELATGTLDNTKVLIHFGVLKRTFLFRVIFLENYQIGPQFLFRNFDYSYPTRV